MPFLTPENILQDKDNTLNKKEKSQLQSFAKQLNQIWDKVKIYLNKNLNSQEKKELNAWLREKDLTFTSAKIPSKPIQLGIL